MKLKVLSGARNAAVRFGLQSEIIFENVIIDIISKSLKI
jgi:hypothetical protein